MKTKNMLMIGKIVAHFDRFYVNLTRLLIFQINEAIFQFKSMNLYKALSIKILLIV